MQPTTFTSQDFIDSWVFDLQHDFSKDGVPASWGPGTLGPRQWGSEDAKIELTGQPSALAVSPDGALLAVAVTNLIFIYNLTTFTLQNTLRGHQGHISYLGFSPRAPLLVSSSEMRGKNREQIIRIWNLEEYEYEDRTTTDILLEKLLDVSREEFINRKLWLADEVDAVAPAMKQGFEDIIRAAEVRQDIAHGKALDGRVAGFGAQAFSPNGKFMFYLPGRTEIAVYDVMERREHLRLRGHTDAIMWVGSSPDGTLIGSSAWDGTVRLWRSDTGALLHTLSNNGQQSWAGAFSPDGKLIAAGAGDAKIRIWRVDTGELIHTLEGGTEWIRALDFTTTHYRDDDDEDALYIAAGGDGIRVFDVRNGERVQLWQPKGTNYRWMYEIADIQYSPRNITPRVLGMKAPDGRIVLYDGESNVKWEFEQPLTDARRYVGSGKMIFSPTSRSVISADMDNVVRIWKF